MPKETEFERSIADRVKLRKQKLNIINKNKEKINNELFNLTRVKISKTLLRSLIMMLFS